MLRPPGCELHLVLFLTISMCVWRLVQVYRSLQGDQKAAFLKQFQANKGKDLSWVRSYSEHVTSTEESKRGSVEGFFLRSYILRR